MRYVLAMMILAMMILAVVAGALMIDTMVMARTPQVLSEIINLIKPCLSLIWS